MSRDVQVRNSATLVDFLSFQDSSIVFFCVVYGCSLEIAENKQIIIQGMRESANDSHPPPFTAQITNNHPHQQALVQATQAVCPKQEQLFELKLKSILGSQLTQENSGISCAFKAHLLIMGFERIRARRLGRAFISLRAIVDSSPELLAAAGTYQSPCKETSNNQPKQGHLLCNYKNASQQSRAVGQLLPTSFLQSLHLKNSHKFLNKQLFQSRVEVGSLSKRVRDLQGELTEALRRQERQAIKKQQSLQSLVEQLGEKNEVIDQLKGIVRTLKAKMNAKHNISGLVLEEDTESLRKSLLHMEGVNDRLNADLARLRQDYTALINQVKVFAAENEKLKSEINKMREEGFEADAAKQQAGLAKKESSIWQRRLQKKEERLRVLEKRLNELARSKGSAVSPCIAFCSQKRLEQVVAAEPSQRELDLCTKVESIFEFLFHIEDPSYQLHSAPLFDEEEKQLLQSQKLKISAVLQNRSKSHWVSPAKSKTMQEQSQMVNDFGCTVLDLIEAESKRPSCSALQHSSRKGQAEVLRLRQLVGELKEKQLFVRAVLLSFLKSLELHSLKKQSQNIIELLYDCFEYSEEERASIFHSRPRKIFGFI